MPLIRPTWCPLGTGALYNESETLTTLLDPQVLPFDIGKVPCVKTYFCFVGSPFFTGLLEQFIYEGDGQVIAYSRPDVVKDSLGNVLCTISYTVDGALQIIPHLASYYTGPPAPSAPWKGTGVSSGLPFPGAFGPYYFTFVASDGVNVSLNVTGGPSAPVQVLGPYDIGAGEKMGTLIVPIATNLTHPAPAGSVSIIPDTLPILGDVYSAYFTLPSPAWT